MSFNLESYAESLEQKAIIIGGIDEAAKANNDLVMKSIEQVGRKFSKSYNDFFGIGVGGSRIRGLNKVDSDIDYVVIAPDSSPCTDYIRREIKYVLEQNGLDNVLDARIESFSEFVISTDAKKFIENLDTEFSHLISFVNYFAFTNSNLNIAMLCALEVLVARPSSIDEMWSYLEEQHQLIVLGERDHVCNSIYEKTGIEESDVRSIITPELMERRYKKFQLSEPVKLYKKYLHWYRSNENELEGFIMNDVYKEVCELISSGDFS